MTVLKNLERRVVICIWCATPVLAEMILTLDYLEEASITDEQIRLWTNKDQLLSHVVQFSASVAKALFSTRIETLLVSQNRVNLFQKLYYVGSMGCCSGTGMLKYVTRVTYWTFRYMQDERTSSDSDMVAKHRL